MKSIIIKLMILVTIRYTQIDTVVDILRENPSKNIVFVGNNTNANYTSSLLKDKNVMFAFLVSAGHRESNRVVSVDLKKITIGQLVNAKSNKNLLMKFLQIQNIRLSMNLIWVIIFCVMLPLLYL